ncbi:DUF2141 domain-containing protein [Sphingomonas sp. PR090111-T3T-6A]|uniref:DUF2141 domain-containing protein n=1 Tax=Sphingomonas sp. PR090111-T3T-6A TaxID=685778 RepID=UPI000373F57B|nr:DUF2141 domain-containing protein [Sphingomonas sp. PR090111-T3T-6A]
MIRVLPLLLLVGAAPIASSPSLGTAEGRCRPDEPGPAILISPLGLKDRTGTLRAELFPPDQAGFLADDNVLVAAHKTFRRAIIPLPAQGPVRLCIRVPSPGAYTLALTHDRAGKPKFDFWRDGIGFPGNPRIGHAAPPAAEARILAGPGLTRTAIILNYRRGILGFGPLG